MNFSVRFSDSLRRRLALYCERTGTTRSAILQRAVDEFLARADQDGDSDQTAPKSGSRIYRAFFRAGLIGGAVDGATPISAHHTMQAGSADKQAVRAAVAKRLKREPA